MPYSSVRTWACDNCGEESIATGGEMDAPGWLEIRQRGSWVAQRICDTTVGVFCCLYCAMEFLQNKYEESL